MSPRPADRALKKLVAELAAVRPEDLEAILDDLSAEQRARVNGLLAEYRGAEPPSRPPAGEAPVDAIEGLSAWLGARIRAAADGGESLAWPSMGAADFAMTEGGRAALLASAAKARALYPARRPAARPAESRGSLSGFLAMLRRGA